MVAPIRKDWVASHLGRFGPSPLLSSGVVGSWGGSRVCRCLLLKFKHVRDRGSIAGLWDGLALQVHVESLKW